MSKYIFLSIIFILLIINILIIRNVFLQIRRKDFKYSNNILKITFFIVILVYGFWSYQRYLLLVKVDNFGTEISSILSSYKITNGKYPKNINELNNYKEYKEKKYYLLWPLTHEFGLEGSENEDSYKYTFYAYGLDKDDDKLMKEYEIKFIYAFIPFMDGDILLRKDIIKKITPENEFNRSEN